MSHARLKLILFFRQLIVKKFSQGQPEDYRLESSHLDENLSSRITRRNQFYPEYHLPGEKRILKQGKSWCPYLNLSRYSGVLLSTAPAYQRVI